MEAPIVNGMTEHGTHLNQRHAPRSQRIDAQSAPKASGAMVHSERQTVRMVFVENLPRFHITTSQLHDAGVHPHPDSVNQDIGHSGPLFDNRRFGRMNQHDPGKWCRDLARLVAMNRDGIGARVRV